MTHEGSEEISPGHGQFSPTLPAQASSPCQGRIGTEHSQERGACPSDRHGSAAVSCHTPWFIQNDAKAQKKSTSPAVCRELNANS